MQIYYADPGSARKWSLPEWSSTNKINNTPIIKVWKCRPFHDQVDVLNELVELKIKEQFVNICKYGVRN